MDTPSLTILLDWIAAHPNWTGVLVFTIAFAESLAVAGLLVPGAIMLFGIGTLIGTGTTPFLSTALWAIAGAFFGDGLSFLLGRVYHEQLRKIWPLSHYPSLIDKGVAFFLKHGGKSIFLGRFVGPIRPIIPAVAGMLDMPSRTFFSINLCSAILWAPAYLLPGILVGASFGLAAETATRLVILIALSLLLIVAVFWSIRRIALWFAPRAQSFAHRSLSWGYRHPRYNPWLTAVLGPNHPHKGALLAMSALLILVLFTLLFLVGGLYWYSKASAVDITSYYFLQNLRNPWSDRIMLTLNGLGEQEILLGLSVALCIWFSKLRLWRSNLYFFATLLASITVTVLLHKTLPITPPAPMLEHLKVQASFPSLQATISVAVYGFLAVVVSRELNPALRWMPYTLSAMAILLGTFSLLYLGAHWLTDVIAGIALGSVWVLLFGIIYRSHLTQPLPLPRLLQLLSVGLIVGSLWFHYDHYEHNKAKYTQPTPTIVRTTEPWWTLGWQELELYRNDFRALNTQPFNIQWVGAIDKLEQQLRLLGWSTPPPLNFSSAMRWLNTNTPLTDLPLLPHIHNGLHEVVSFVYPINANQQWVLRLWPSHYYTRDCNLQIWQGALSLQATHQALALLSFPRTEAEFVSPTAAIGEQLQQIRSKVVYRYPANSIPEGASWDGELLLLQSHQGNCAASAQ